MADGLLIDGMDVDYGVVRDDPGGLGHVRNHFHLVAKKTPEARLELVPKTQESFLQM